jgi:hypothetical protein
MKPGSGRFALVVVCLLAARPAWAGAPAGSYGLEIGADNELWSPSGDDSHCDDDGMGDTICVLTSVSTDATGAVSGTGQLQLHFPGLLDADVPAVFGGRLSGTTRNPVAKIAASMSGPGTLSDPNDPNSPGFPVTVSATARLACRNPLPHGPEFQCRGPLKLCLEAFGRRSCHSEVIKTVSAAAGGSWSLALDLATSAAGAVTGSATATLANSASESFDVSGKYAAKSDTAKLALRPSLASKDKLAFGRLAIAGGALQSGQLQFKVAGLKGTRVLIAPP